MPEPTKISLAELWKHETEAVAAGWESMGKKSATLWSVLGAMLTGWLQFIEGFTARHEIIISFVNVVAVALIIFLAQFLVSLSRSSALASKTAKENLDKQSAESAKERQILSTELEKIKSAQAELEIEFINPMEMDAILHRWPLRVKVTHSDSKQTLKNVRVLITKIECPDWNNKPILSFELKKIRLPLYLPETGSADNSKAHEISPKPFGKTFDVFAVRANMAESIVWLAPFEPPSEKEFFNPRKRDYWSKNEFRFTANDIRDGSGKFTIELLVTADGTGTLLKTTILEVPIDAFKKSVDGKLEFSLDHRPPAWIV